jgi:hypothetical protein
LLCHADSLNHDDRRANARGCLNDFVERLMPRGGQLLGWVGVVVVVAWAIVAVVTVGGRVVFDRRGVSQGKAARRPGAERRLVLAAQARYRTGLGRWRRVRAIRELGRLRHPATRIVVVRALAEEKGELLEASVRALGDLGGRWAAACLVDILERGAMPRSRIASQLERLAAEAAPGLEGLLANRDPEVRRWAATLLASCPQVATDRLIGLLSDRSAEVRAAAAETLGRRGEDAATRDVCVLLEDDAWFVRVHAARALSALGTIDDALSVGPLLADGRWWVRNAAKEALRTRGSEIAESVLPFLDSHDPFARDGAAEILQDVGYLEELRRSKSNPQLLDRLTKTLVSATAETP